MTLVAQIPQLESIDRAIAALAAFVVVIALWSMLAALLIVAAVKGEMPGWAIAVAAIAHPLSVASAGWSLVVWADRAAASPLPVLVLVLVPPLLAGYALWARLPQVHGALPPQAMSGGLLGVVLLLSVGQIVDQSIIDARRAAEARAAQQAYEAEQARRERERREENLARFNRLNDASPLVAWGEFIGKGNELEKQALQRARALPHRQHDAEAMLAAGDAFPLYHFEDLRLTATPEFCGATHDFLVKRAGDGRPSAEHPMIYSLSNALEPVMPTLHWLVGQGCSLDTAVAAVEETALAYPKIEARETFLNTLVELDSRWRACNGTAKLPADRRLAACDKLITDGQPSPSLVASAYFERAGAHYDNGDFDAAIADYGEAISRRPDFPAAFNNRGNAFDSKGDVEAALRDYDEALRLKPDFAMALSNRGLLYVEKGNLDQAISEYDAAISLRPDYADGLRNRGRARFLKGDFAAAVSDLESALGLKRRDPSVVLWLHLARSRAGIPALEPLRHDTDALDRDAWPWPIVAVFLGEQEAVAALAAAETGDPANRNDHACEARFYLGEKAAAEGNVATAGDLLRQAEQICAAGTVERASARIELARLGQ